MATTSHMVAICPVLHNVISYAYAWLLCWILLTKGKITENVVPCPTLLATFISPLCFWTILYAVDNPDAILTRDPPAEKPKRRPELIEGSDAWKDWWHYVPSKIVKHGEPIRFETGRPLFYISYRFLQTTSKKIAGCFYEKNRLGIGPRRLQAERTH